MAKISKKYEPDIDLTVFSVVGAATFEEIWEQTRIFLNDKPTRLVLWDFTEGTVALISSEEAERIAALGSNIRPNIKGGKAAFLAPKDIDFGISRMFQVFSEIKNFTFEIEVFRDMSTAQEWLELVQ